MCLGNPTRARVGVFLFEGPRRLLVRLSGQATSAWAGRVHPLGLRQGSAVTRRHAPPTPIRWEGRTADHPGPNAETRTPRNRPLAARPSGSTPRQYPTPSGALPLLGVDPCPGDLCWTRDRVTRWPRRPTMGEAAEACRRPFWDGPTNLESHQGSTGSCRVAGCALHKRDPSGRNRASPLDQTPSRSAAKIWLSSPAT